MRNRDKPSSQIMIDAVDNTGCSFGLTKLEAAAIAAMQGALSTSISGAHKIPVNLVREAVECANALFDELEKGND